MKRFCSAASIKSLARAEFSSKIEITVNRRSEYLFFFMRVFVSFDAVLSSPVWFPSYILDTHTVRCSKCFLKKF